MAVDLLKNGQFEVSKLVSHSFSLEGIAEAFETQLDSEKAIKVAVHC